MSIIGQAAGPEVPGAAYMLIALVTAGGLVVAAALGLFRRGAVVGRERVPATRPGWPVLLLLLVGTGVWLGTQTAVGVYRQAEWSRSGREGRFEIKDLSPADFAFLATVPGTAAVVAVVGFWLLMRRQVRPRLGLEPSDLPRGVLHGVLGILLVMPVVVWASVGTEWVYRQIEFQHPAEHDLLKLMKEAGNPAVRWLLIFGAVGVAPLVEELLFRGLFQTLLVWTFTRQLLPISRPAVAAAAAAAPPEGSPSWPGAGPPPLPYVPPELPSEPAHTSRLALARWMAILIASVVFAAVHPAWTIPPILVLSVCLGFAYERTGNLWVPVTLHALFNGLQTLQYLFLFPE